MLGADLLVPAPGRPLVFSSEHLFARWQRRVPASHRGFLDFMAGITRTTRLAPSRIGGFPAVLMASDGAPTAFLPIEGGGVVARVFAGEKEALGRADPARVKHWKPDPRTCDFAGDGHALFCDGGARLAVPLPDGTYAIASARSTARGATVELWRFTRVGDRVPSPVDVESPVELSDADADAAEEMPWVTAEDGPVVVIPREASARWRGGRVMAGEQPSLATVKGVEALVLPPGGSVAFWPTDSGGLILSAGEGMNDDCVAAALSIPDERFAALPITLLVGPSGALACFDGAHPRGDADAVDAALPPGRYAVSFAGPFRIPSASVAYAIRLSASGEG